MNFINVYHGTNHTIEKFTGLVYFTPQEDAAQGYARGKVKKCETFYVYQAEINPKKIMVVQTMQEIGSLRESDLKDLRSQEYDFVFYDGSGKEKIPEYVPLYPEKMKIVRIESFIK